GQRVDELDPAGVLVRCDLRLHELLQLLDLRVVAGDARSEHDVRHDDHAACLVGGADDAALRHLGVAQQRLLHLRAGDVVPGRDDHVVRSGLVPEIAVRVAHVRVAGEVAAVLDVRPLPGVGEVTAAGRSLHREPADLAVRHRAAFVVDDPGDVPGNRPAGRAGPDVVVGGGDEDVQQFGRADPVDDPHSGGVVERLH